MTRRFPPPWTVHSNEDAYWVEDTNGKRFGFCYFRDREVIGTGDEAFQSRDEARRLATNIAKLPELLGGSPRQPSPAESLIPPNSLAQTQG